MNLGIKKLNKSLLSLKANARSCLSSVAVLASEWGGGRGARIRRGAVYLPKFTDSPSSAQRSLGRSSLGDGHAEVPRQPCGAIRSQQQAAGLLLQGSCQRGKDGIGAEKMRGTLQLPCSQTPLGVWPEHGQDLGCQELVVQEDILVPPPGEGATESQLGLSRNRAAPAAAFGSCIPHAAASCPQTCHSNVAPEMLCFYTTCDPSRNVKLPLNLLYWLNQQV